MSEMILVNAPSGCGKSTAIRSLFGEKKRAYTYTSRSPREGEVEGVDRRFVSEEEFARLRSNGGIIAHYEAFGGLYGLAGDVLEALAGGERVVEQVVPFKGMQLFAEALAGFTVRKVLFLAEMEDLELRLQDRDLTDFENRTEENRGFILDYLINIKMYDQVRFLFPTRLLQSQKEFVDASIDDWRKGDYSVEAIDKSMFVNKWALQRINALRDNPLLYTLLSEVAEKHLRDDLDIVKDSELEEALAASGKNVPTTPEAHFVADLFTFNSLLGSTGFGGREWIEYAINRMSESTTPQDGEHPVLKGVLERLDSRFSWMEKLNVTLESGGKGKEEYRNSLKSYYALHPLQDFHLLNYYSNFVNRSTKVYPKLNVLYNTHLKGFLMGVAPYPAKVLNMFVGGIYNTRIDDYEEKIFDNLKFSAEQSMAEMQEVLLVKDEDLPDRYLERAIVQSHTVALEAAKVEVQMDAFVWAYGLTYPSENEHVREEIIPLIARLAGVTKPAQDYLLQEYMLNALANFSENLLRATIADRAEPLSLDNTTSYPVFRNKGEFVSNYLPQRISSPEESLYRLKKSLPILAEVTS